MSKLGVLCLLFGLTFGLIGCEQKPEQKPEPDLVEVLAKPNWAALENLKSSSDQFRVEVTGQTKLKLGDEMVFQVSSSQKGRLWMVQVDANDEVTFLFPNMPDQDNRILGNRPVKIPPNHADWAIDAIEPKGKSLVAAVVTTEQFDLYKGISRGGIRQLANILTGAEDWGVGHMVVTVD